MKQTIKSHFDYKPHLKILFIILKSAYCITFNCIKAQEWQTVALKMLRKKSEINVALTTLSINLC